MTNYFKFYVSMGREETVTGTEIKLKLFLCLFEALAGKVYGGIYL
jgi:hypothetical protein